MTISPITHSLYKFGGTVRQAASLFFTLPASITPKDTFQVAPQNLFNVPAPTFSQISFSQGITSILPDTFQPQVFDMATFPQIPLGASQFAFAGQLDFAELLGLYMTISALIPGDKLIIQAITLGLIASYIAKNNQARLVVKEHILKANEKVPGIVGEIKALDFNSITNKDQAHQVAQLLEKLYLYADHHPAEQYRPVKQSFTSQAVENVTPSFWYKWREKIYHFWHKHDEKMGPNERLEKRTQPEDIKNMIQQTLKWLVLYPFYRKHIHRALALARGAEWNENIFQETYSKKPKVPVENSDVSFSKRAWQRIKKETRHLKHRIIHDNAIIAKGQEKIPPYEVSPQEVKGLTFKLAMMIRNRLDHDFSVFYYSEFGAGHDLNVLRQELEIYSALLKFQDYPAVNRFRGRVIEIEHLLKS